MYKYYNTHIKMDLSNEQIHKETSHNNLEKNYAEGGCSMKEFYLDVLLPYHRKDNLLDDAIQSCLFALPENSRILLIDTKGIGPTNFSGYENVKEITSQGADYLNALKIGLLNSDSEYIALMNSDDLIDPRRFSNQIKALSGSSYDICVTNVSKFVTRRFGKKLLVPPLFGQPPRTFHESILLLGSFRADASWLFKSDWARKNNLFNASSDLSDWTTAMRVLTSTNTIVLDEELYNYRIHSGQLSQNRDFHKNKNFVSAWETLNNKLDFRELTANQIEILTSNYGQIKTKELESIFLWLNELQDYLASNLPQSENQRVKHLISRRRLFICYKYRVLKLQLQDVRILGTVFLEYCKFRKFLRGDI